MQQSMQIGLDDLKASFAEMVATAVFVFIGVGAIASFIASNEGASLTDGIILIGLAHGLAIALLVAGIGGISGGHINPAVTFAMLLTGNITLPRAVLYVIAQLLGAAIGMALLRAFVEDAVILAIPGSGGHAISDSVVGSTMNGFAIEAVLTFVLVWTVFAAAVSPRGAGAIAPLAIGFAVLCIHLVAIPMTGAGVNPARTFGPALIMGRWDDHWVYWIGPLLGGGLAGLSYWFIYLSGRLTADEKMSTDAAE